MEYVTVQGNTAHGVGITGAPYTAKQNDLWGGSDNGPAYYHGTVREHSYLASGRICYAQLGQAGTSITIAEWNEDFLWSDMNYNSGGCSIQILYLIDE